MTTAKKTIPLGDVTREQVLDAIKEFDDIGKEEFLSRHGFGESTRYLLRHNGKSYSPKAILGVAANLSCRELYGGKNQHPILKKLGFEIVVKSKSQDSRDAELTPIIANKPVAPCINRIYYGPPGTGKTFKLLTRP